MRQALLLLGVAAVAIALTAIWANRAARERVTNAQVPSAPPKVVVPAGTAISIKLVQGISEGSKPGEQLQALTTDPIVLGSELAIPADTRVTVTIVRMRDGRGDDDDIADVTLQPKEIIFRDRSVPIHATPITIKMKRMSDVGLLARSMGGMLGGAVGAAGSASVGRDPGFGAGTVGGQSAGDSSETGVPRVLVFKTTAPTDLTGVEW
jgi:hypothetical protein